MGKLFGDRPAAAVSIVEPSMSRWYAHRARVAFFATAAIVGLLSAAVISTSLHVVLAVLLGLLLGVVSGLVVATVVRAWPVLRVLWWWLLEIVASLLTVAGLMWLSRAASPWLAVAAAIALAAAGMVRPVRHQLTAWSWCVVTRHRLRACFTEFIRAGSRTRPTGLPLILWARPTPAGERVWVWLRPGLDLTDLDGKVGKVAVTCWASEARVVRASARYAALIRVDVTRRDPLTGLVVSPLVRWFRQADGPLPASPGIAPSGLDLDDVPQVLVEPRSARR